jgi:hypothetical protein
MNIIKTLNQKIMKTRALLKLKNSFALFALLTAILCVACSKEDPETEPALMNYEEIKLSDIKAKESVLSPSGMVISDAAGIYFKPGDILFYKTSMGRLGKMQIISVDQAANYKITLKATTYESTGAVCSECTSAQVRGTWIFDLDQMVELDDISENEDFWNERINVTDTHFTPQNGASFLRYSI